MPLLAERRPGPVPLPGRGAHAGAGGTDGGAIRASRPRSRGRPAGRLPRARGHAQSLEIVVTGRADDHGGPEFLERLVAAASHNHALLERAGIAHTFTLVEWNPVPGRRLLAEAVAERLPFWGRAYVVDPAWHAAISTNPRLQFMEFFAKNVAVRRSTADAILTTNSDVFLSKALVARLAEAPLEDEHVYRAVRYDVDRHCDWRAGARREAVLADPRHHVRVNQLTAPEFSNAAGDFLLLTRATWQRLRGFNETVRLRQDPQGRPVLPSRLDRGADVRDARADLAPRSRRLLLERRRPARLAGRAVRAGVAVARGLPQPGRLGSRGGRLRRRPPARSSCCAPSSAAGDDDRVVGVDAATGVAAARRRGPVGRTLLAAFGGARRRSGPGSPALRLRDGSRLAIGGPDWATPWLAAAARAAGHVVVGLYTADARVVGTVRCGYVARTWRARRRRRGRLRHRPARSRRRGAAAARRLHAGRSTACCRPRPTRCRRACRPSWRCSSTVQRADADDPRDAGRRRADGALRGARHAGRSRPLRARLRGGARLGEARPPRRSRAHLRRRRRRRRGRRRAAARGPGSTWGASATSAATTPRRASTSRRCCRRRRTIAAPAAISRRSTRRPAARA